MCYSLNCLLILFLYPKKTPQNPKKKKKKKKNPNENEFLVQALAYEIALVLTTQLEIVHDCSMLLLGKKKIVFHDDTGTVIIWMPSHRLGLLIRMYT